MIAATYIFTWLITRIALRRRRISANGIALMYGALGLWVMMAAIPAAALMGWWVVVWFALVATTLYLLAYIERSAIFIPIGHAFTLLALAQMLDVLHVSFGWSLVILALISLAATITTYEIARVRQGQFARQLMRSSEITAIGYPSFIGLIAGVLGAFTGSETMMTLSSLAVAAMGVTLCYEAFMSRRFTLLDIGAFVILAALQRVLAIVAPGVHYLAYMHMWAMLAFVLALVYYHRHRRDNGVMRLIIALVMISVPGVIAAFGEGVCTRSCFSSSMLQLCLQASQNHTNSLRFGVLVV